MEILKRNWKIKLLSLFISIFLWSFIITNENPTVTSRLTAVPILFENTDALDKKGLIISDKLQRQMDISISGRRNSIINLTNQHVRVSADFSDASEGVQKVKLRYSMPEGIEVVNAEKTIDVNIEKIISKDFVVNLEAQGAMMADYILESSSITPDSITIKGPRTKIEKITKVKTSLDMTKLEGYTTINSELVALDEEGNKVEGVIFGQQFVNISLDILKQKEVPIKLNLVGQISGDLKLANSTLNKSKVYVKGPKEAVDKLENISTLEIDISNIKDSGRKDVELSLPTDVLLVDNATDIFVEFEVEKKVEKTLTIPKDKITVNSKSNMEATVNSNSVAIKLKGFSKEIEKLTLENTRLVVDALARGPGKYSISPSLLVDGKNYKDESIISIDNVSITLQAK